MAAVRLFVPAAAAVGTPVQTRCVEIHTVKVRLDLLRTLDGKEVQFVGVELVTRQIVSTLVEPGPPAARR